MDLNESVVHFSRANGGIAKLDNFGDTALSLKCLGSSAGRLMGSSHHNHKLCSDVSNCPDDGCRLVLGLGPTPPSFYYNVRVNNNKKVSASSGTVQELSSGGHSILQLGPPAATMDTFSGLDCSLLTYTESNVSQPVVDESSTSAKRSGGYMPSLLFAPRTENVRQPSRMQECSTNFGTDAYNSQLSHESEFSVGAFSDRTASATSSQQRTSNPKKCKFMGCGKGARGAYGLCIGHGGGQRCQKAGCNKGAESKTTFCKAHGGGKRCQHLGCTKSAEGKTDFCISHGGGRRCGFPEGCTKAARGKSGLCIKHGGGKRCRIEGCTRSAEGQAGLCISHGGGRRCQSSGCTKGAQGSTNYCKAHGGGKRCIFAGCTKGAEGSTPLCKAHGGGKRCMFDGGGICPKSVHGGTSFCVAHGGGKRCVVAGCTKSARGRTDCCVKHGGGKRCKSVGCEKSAQGSTDFCKAHGGGKRCSWGGDWKCEKFARGKSGLCAAHNSMSQEKSGSKIGLIGPGLFRGLVSTCSQTTTTATATTTTTNTDHSQSGVSAISDCTDSIDHTPQLHHPEKRHKVMIPMQVLVPPSMKSLSFSNTERPETETNNKSSSNGRNIFDFMIPEERVHGGGLMSLLNGSLRNKHSIDGI
uniref:Putative WRKY transcription factor 19 n=1 Tax=Noccaea caerulescens TaxID=107243 RepID=A0A1J3CFL9_NOCCA